MHHVRACPFYISAKKCPEKQEKQVQNAQVLSVNLKMCKGEGSKEAGGVLQERKNTKNGRLSRKTVFETIFCLNPYLGLQNLSPTLQTTVVF